MGGETFRNVGEGATAEEAFRAEVDQALLQHGHRGYTGTIAEKNRFTLITPPFTVHPGSESDKVLSDYAEQLLRDEDPRVSDKWGPAGALKLSEGRWLFFGWASS